MEYKIKPPKGREDEVDAGHVTVQFRPATLGDKESHRSKKKLLGSGIVSRRDAKDMSKASVEAPVDLLQVAQIDDKILSIEIISCRDLMVADKNGSSDPFVKIKMGEKQVHKTKHIKKT